MNQGHSKSSHCGRFRQQPMILIDQMKHIKTRNWNKSIIWLVGVWSKHSQKGVFLRNRLSSPSSSKIWKRKRQKYTELWKQDWRIGLMSAEYDLRAGYGFIQNPNAPGSVSQQSLAIIYNKNSNYNTLKVYLKPRLTPQNNNIGGQSKTGLNSGWSSIAHCDWVTNSFGIWPS